MALFPTWYFDESKWLVLASRMQQKSKPMTVTKHRVHQKEQALVTAWESSGHTVIDLGAGTATFAIQASLAGASVHAVDVSQAMLTNAQRLKSWCY